MDTQADNNQTNEDLQDNQLATLTFPSGINLEELLPNTTTGEVGIFFVVYDQSTLFPVGEDGPNNEMNVVGSSVVSFTIAGLRPGTVLPQPILIDFRIINPVMGNTEV